MPNAQMKRIHQTKYIPFIAILTAGFTATIAQIIFLREMLVIFYGNELSAGLIFSGWLIWTGLGSAISVKWSTRVSSYAPVLGLMLAIFAALLPLSVLVIRASRIIWGLPMGELPSFGKMILIIFSSTGILCPITGAAFGICWAIHRNISKEDASAFFKPLMIYLGEALGAACGGLLFYFLFLPFFKTLTSVWIISSFTLCVSGWLARSSKSMQMGKYTAVTWSLILILLMAGIIFGDRIERMSRQWQWGSTIHAVHDSAYHNIVILKKKSQLSVFTNGLWMFSSPDILSTEHAVHLALLQHPDPRKILILGGGNIGLPQEIFKHPNVHRIDYVEPDPDLLRFVRGHLAPESTQSLNDPRVQIYHLDPRTFMRRNLHKYDVILMNVGDPITAQMNRFYTEEFFHHVKARLMPNGVFSFAVSGGEDMLGSNQALFLGSIRKTLQRVFKDILIYPGDQTRFFATDQRNLLIKDPFTLADQITGRNLKLVYIREDYLANALNPFRLDYINSILEDVPGTVINRDFFPICYFHNLMLWVTQWHSTLPNLLKKLAAVHVGWIWGMLAGLGLVVFVFFRIGVPKYAAAVSGCILISGAIEMVLQLILLLGFQIIEGYVYRQLALIIAFFMTGLAVGTGLVSLLKPDTMGIERSASFFFGAQVLLGIIPLGLALLFPMLLKEGATSFSPAAMGWIFSGISFVTGMAGGSHFALAVSTLTVSGAHLEKIGGRFYALDLGGAAGGVLVAACIILPIYGVMNTLYFLSALSVISLFTLFRRS